MQDQGILYNTVMSRHDVTIESLVRPMSQKNKYEGHWKEKQSSERPSY